MKKKNFVPCFKLAVLGAVFSGKTSLCSRFVNHSFDYLYQTTEDTRPYRKFLDLNDENSEQQAGDQVCVLEIDDIFGTDHPDIIDNPRKAALLKKIIENDPVVHKQPLGIYSEKSYSGFIFVFDANDKYSYTHIKQIIEYIISIEEQKIKDKIKNFRPGKKYLVATKTDKYIPTGVNDLLKEAKDFSIKKGIKFKRTSALENINIFSTFQELAVDIYFDQSISNMISGNIDSAEKRSDNRLGIRRTWRDGCADIVFCSSKREQNSELPEEDDETIEPSDMREGTESESKCTVF
mmetsp:Transcript_41503/g.47786  ORF Transcript_41503/g.47786 Transcript_41503/m.47786 type:complete len:293 (+) Transcript_41503:26-904(+)